MRLLFFVFLLISATIIAQLLVCTLGLPTIARFAYRRTYAYHRWLGAMLHGAAYLFGVLRLPFTFVPFLLKRALLRSQDRSTLWHTPSMQIVRLAGEIANLLIGYVVLKSLVPDARILIALSAGAETLRLTAQKDQMVASAVWQMIPHQRIARLLQKRQIWTQSSYCRYYQADHAVRLRYLRRLIKLIQQHDPLLNRRLDHFHGLRIVPNSHYLRSGNVRDIARGEVFVHQAWTNDPWLVIGLALRRTPWIFDPRELARPFRYRTSANHVMARFVFDYAHICPSFAWYQFGHEIKAASHTILLLALRIFGIERERHVQANGCYAFEPATFHAESHLLNDHATLMHIRQRRMNGERLTSLMIAQEYAYPIKYVETVLLKVSPEFEVDHAENTRSMADAVISGASQ